MTKPGWRRISLRGFLILMTAACLGFGALLGKSVRQRSAVAKVVRSGGTVSYDDGSFYHNGRLERISELTTSSGLTLRATSAPKTDFPNSWIPSWMQERLGVDFFESVVGISIGAEWPDDEHVDFAAFPDLNWVILNGNNANDDVIETIAECQSLEHFCAQPTYEQGPSGKHLRERPELSAIGLGHLKNIETLQGITITGSRSDDRALEVIAQIGSLERLDLRGVKMTSQGWKSLAKCSNLTLLRLSTQTNPISDIDVQYLKSLSKLTELDVTGNFSGSATRSFLRLVHDLPLSHIEKTDCPTDAKHRLDQLHKWLSTYDTGPHEEGFVLAEAFESKGDYHEALKALPTIFNDSMTKNEIERLIDHMRINDGQLTIAKTLEILSELRWRGTLQQ